jgi:hypothetical protein
MGTIPFTIASKKIRQYQTTGEEKTRRYRVA